MTEKTEPSQISTRRLHWLMLARVIIATFLLGIAIFVEVKGLETQSAISPGTLTKAIILTYILSIFYPFLLRHIRKTSVNIYIQSLCDVLLITAVVYATGGIRSIYSVFYPLVIIYAALFSGRRGGIIIASAAGIFYGLFADLEFYGVIYPLYSVPIHDYPLNAAYVFTRITTHIFSFYLIAILTNFVVEQEKKARTLLAEKESAFEQLDLLHRSIIESVDTGIMTINMSGQIKSFNRSALEMTGFHFKEIENRKIHEVFPGMGSFIHKSPEGVDAMAVKTRFEIPFRSRQEKDLILGGSTSPLRAPDGATIGNIVIFQDLTSINQMRDSLERSRRLAFIGEIAAGLAHEIRNPLASISGSIQMLKRELGINETNEKLMQIILRGKDQLESFLRDFLLLARPTPGAREDVDVRDTIRDVLDSMRYVPDWHEALKVTLGLPEDSLIIHGNKNELRQMIWNVVLNAIQAMPDGGELTVEAHSRNSNEMDGAELRIIDTGCGIEDREMQKIFEPFYTTREMGTGLGLAVVSRIVEGYRGRIGIQSVPSGGTLCTLWLPCQDLRSKPA